MHKRLLMKWTAMLSARLTALNIGLLRLSLLLRYSLTLTLTLTLFLNAKSALAARERVEKSNSKFSLKKNIFFHH